MPPDFSTRKFAYGNFIFLTTSSTKRTTDSVRQSFKVNLHSRKKLGFLTPFSLSNKSTYLAYFIPKNKRYKRQGCEKQNFAAFIFMGNFALKNP
jgi:hypothetical protein